MKKIVIGVAVFALFLAPFTGQSITREYETDLERICNERGPFDPGCLSIKTDSTLIGLVLKSLWLLRTIFWILAVAFLLIAAYRYLMAGAGGKAEDAKNMIKYAVIAMIVALVATSIPYLVKSILD